MKAGDVLFVSQKKSINENIDFDLIPQICPNLSVHLLMFKTLPGFEQQPSSALHRSGCLWGAVNNKERRRIFPAVFKYKYVHTYIHIIIFSSKITVSSGQQRHLYCTNTLQLYTVNQKYGIFMNFYNLRETAGMSAICCSFTVFIPKVYTCQSKSSNSISILNNVYSSAAENASLGASHHFPWPALLVIMYL